MCGCGREENERKREREREKKSKVMVEQLDAENDFFSNKKVAKSVAKNLLRNKAASKGKTEQMFEAIFIKHIFCFSNFFVFHKKSFSCHRHKLA